MELAVEFLVPALGALSVDPKIEPQVPVSIAKAIDEKIEPIVLISEPTSYGSGYSNLEGLFSRARLHHRGATYAKRGELLRLLWRSIHFRRL